MKEYIIVGDSGEYKGSLIYTCGHSKEHALKVLERERENLSSEYTNLAVKEVDSEDCWWNDPFLAN